MKSLLHLAVFQLTVYLWLRSLMRLKVKGSYEDDRADREARLYVAGLKQRPHSSGKAKAEREAELIVWLVFGIFLLYGISKSSSKSPSDATRVAERFLSPLLPEERCESVIGDLQEEYEVRLKGAGLIRARIWLYRQVLTSLRPLLHEAIKAKLSLLWKTVR
jgi:hypothetical protein